MSAATTNTKSANEPSRLRYAASQGRRLAHARLREIEGGPKASFVTLPASTCESGSARREQRLAVGRELREIGLVHLHDAGRKLGVVEAFDHVLTIMDRPLDELGQRLALCRVLLVLVNEQ